MNTVADAREEQRKAAERTFWEAVWILIVLAVYLAVSALLKLRRERGAGAVPVQV